MGIDIQTAKRISAALADACKIESQNATERIKEHGGEECGELARIVSLR